MYDHGIAKIHLLQPYLWIFKSTNKDFTNKQTDDLLQHGHGTLVGKKKDTNFH